LPATDVARPDQIEDPLIEVALRPLAANAEMQLAAAGFLKMIRAGSSGGEGEMVRRWEELDAGKRSNWKLGLWGLVTMAALAVLVTDLAGVLRVWNSRPNWEDNQATLAAAETRIAGRLDPQQRTLMFGDISLADAVRRKEALWKSEPENPAFFVEYLVACHSHGAGLPEGFLETARRIDPDNAWFTYLAAAAEARSCVTRKSPRSTRVGSRWIPDGPPSWEIADEARLDRAIGLLGEARAQSRCEHYSIPMMRRRLPFLPQGSVSEKSDSIAYLTINVGQPAFATRSLADAIAAKGWLLGGKQDFEGFRELNSAADHFLRGIAGGEAGALVDELVISNQAYRIAASLGPAAAQLGLVGDAARWKDIEERLRDWNETRRSREFRVDGREYQRGVKTGFLAGAILEDMSGFALNPPELNDADIRPLRLVDHEMASRFCCYAGWGILLALAGILSACRFGIPLMIRRLARRMESLLTAGDWAWVLALGLGPPLLYVLAVNRMTPFGGRDFGLVGSYLLLPAAQFLGLLTLWIPVPAWAIRWRLGKRAAVFGMGKSNVWLASVPLILMIAFIPVIGWAATTGSVPEIWKEELDWWSADIPGRASEVRLWIPFALLAVSLLWMIGAAGIAWLGKPASRLQAAIIVQSLIPACGAGMLVLAGLTPVFKAAERHWFREDRLVKFDPARPGWSGYEYEIAMAMRQELRGILGFGK
jgi:hypothetical protein